MRLLDEALLPQVARELRNFIIDIVAVKEGFDLYDAVPCLITDQHEVEAVERLGRKVFLS